MNESIKNAREDLKSKEKEISAKLERRNELSKEGKCTPERIEQLSNYIKELNGFFLGSNEELVDKFIKNFGIAKTEMNGDIKNVDQEVDSTILKELNKKEQDLKNLDDLSVTGIFDRILDGKNNSEFILIVFFACLGDIVPVLISLKHRNPNTFKELLGNMVVWFHELANEIGKINFIPTVSKATLGFLFGIKEKSKCQEILQFLLNTAIIFSPLIIGMNSLFKKVIGPQECDKLYLIFQKIIIRWLYNMLSLS